MYKLRQNSLSANVNVVERLADNAFIPFDPQNRDYADYLKWLEEGNVPEPAED
jgi:hypothetical protein